MMKLRPVSLNRKCLSPSRARLAIDRRIGSADGCACARHVARVRSERGRRLARSSCAAPTIKNTMMVPAAARRNRGASSSATKRHQRSLLYSTCRWLKKPSQSIPAGRRDREQPTGREELGEESRLAVEGASTGRQGEQGQGEHRRLLDMEAAQQAEDDACRQDQERRRDTRHPTAGAIPRPPAGGSNPAMLPRKCESSMTPSGPPRRAPACVRRSTASAPVASSMMPATNTISANRFGARMTGPGADPPDQLTRAQG